MRRTSSNIFEGYKSVGHVSGPLPFIVRHAKSPQDTRIVTIVGRAFHTYTTNLSLVEVSLPHEHDISCLISDERHIFSAAGRSVISWAGRGKQVVQRLDNGHQANVKLITKLGLKSLVSVDEDNTLFNWNLQNREYVNILNFEEATFKISAICQPLNYNEKLLIGSEQGPLELWNIPNEECIYKFAGWGSPVRVIAQSPVGDVVGIGLDDGHIHIHNIKYDEKVMKIYQEYGSVTSMSFRLDGQPYLVTASEAGHLMVWDLERKRLSSQIRDAHLGRISKCQFLRSESLMVTAGADNSLKVWTMDLSDGSGTLLHQRAGHSEPPTYIRFYGPKGFNLLSAGRDSSLKMFHMFSERLNRNLGTARWNQKSKHKSGNTIKKLPPIVCFSAEPAKEKQWDNIVACHEGSSLVSTWNYDKCKMGEHLIHQPTFNKHDISAECCSLTNCGNFLVIGFSNGLIFKYNIQSGIFRQTYETGDLSEHRAHEGPVKGLTVDELNIVLISAGQDSKLKLWNFKSGKLLLTIDCSAPIRKIEFHREVNLIAIALESNRIEIWDLETRTLIRNFPHTSPLIDMTFSPDSRWLIACYEDKSVRTWDLSLGKLIDAFSLSSRCTSLTVSSTGEFLATAHEDSLGISIWCNYTIYCPTPLRTLPTDIKPPILDMPYVKCDELLHDEDTGENSNNELKCILVQRGDNSEPEQAYVSPEHLDSDLVTLSGLPSSRWKNLLFVEELRLKQKIAEDEKRDKPVKVPFFIPVQDGLKPILNKDQLQAHGDANEEDESQVSKLKSQIGELRLLSPVTQCLVECGHTNNFAPFIEKLKELGPSATDAEIRLVGSDVCGDNQAMLCFLDAIEYGLGRKLDYELLVSWLALYLKVHSDLIQLDSKVKRRCFDLLDPVKVSWGRLNERFNEIFSVLNFIRSSIL